MIAEISAARESANELDVILTPQNGFAWEEKNWNYEHVKAGFERGDYFEIIKKPGDDISVY